MFKHKFSTMASQYSLSTTIKLNNDILMPRIHLGTYQTSGRETSNMVTHALDAGYRAIDSAEWYANEKEVGSSILKFVREKGVRREDIWFTTKLKDNRGYEETRRKIKESVTKSGLGYIDLYLLHSPYGGAQKRKECWRAVEDAIGDGEVRTGGVSNFGVRHVSFIHWVCFARAYEVVKLQDILESQPRIRPAVNQIEVHPFNTQLEITAFCEENQIVVEAYAPLAQALRMKNSTIVRLAKKYGCTSAQLMVRWSLQHGYIPLPKSSNAKRIVENADVGSFDIGSEDMIVLDGLDEKLVTDWDPTDAP